MVEEPSNATLGEALPPGSTLVLASHNAHKQAEFSGLLEPLGLKVRSAAELGLPVPDETAGTFIGNAAIKAEAAAAATGLPALADDSGLMVDALGGDPGVDSALWAVDGDFAPAMAKILAALAQSPSREARFIAVLALARAGSETIYFEGVVDGTIADAPRGAGMGYDPVFIPSQGDGRTFGEMTGAEKSGGAHPLSHRARAAAKLVAALRA